MACASLYYIPRQWIRSVEGSLRKIHLSQQGDVFVLGEPIGELVGVVDGGC